MPKVVASIPGGSCTDLYYASGAAEVLPCKSWEVTANQLDLPALTTLSVAGCGRLQQGVALWATSVALLQAVDN